MGRKKWSISGVGILFLLVVTTVSSNAQTQDSFKSASGMSKAQIAAIENSLASAYQKAMLSAKTTATATKISVTTDGSGHQIISSWKCVSNWIINGDPYVSRLISGSSFAGHTKVSYYLSGGWKATGSNKRSFHGTSQLRAWWQERHHIALVALETSGRFRNLLNK